MFDGLDGLTAQIQAFRQEGMKLYFDPKDYAQMGLAIFAGLFLALGLAGQVNKRL